MSHFRTSALVPGVAFITGGARGLGNAIAVSFAKDGARGVVLVDIQDEATFAEGRKAVEEFIRPDGKVLTIRCDVTDESQVEAAVKQTVDEFGRIDYAANFAGIAGPLGSMTETSLSDWKKVMEVNSAGVWLATKHELAQMRKQSSIEGIESGRVGQRGSIVNCASVNSIQAGAGTTGYTSSKHAVWGITKAAALEARGDEVRINCVSPGFLLTKLLDSHMSGASEVGKALAQDGWAGFERRQGRKASFDEVGDVVVLLSTPRMSLVVGHNLVIDGGFTINENPE